MRGIKNFSEFVELGIVKKQTPDRSRAEYLTESSKNSYNLLLKKIELLDITNSSASDLIISCYDILMQLIRACMLLEGYNASGGGAHEAEVSYLRNIKFNESDVQFANQIRFFRNGMLYYGTKLDKEYASKVIKFTKKNYKRLLEIMNKKQNN